MVHLFRHALILIVVGCPQVHHYGCVIKTGTLKDIMQGQGRLMGMLITLGKVDTSDKHDYPTSLVINIRVFVWMDERKHPCGQFIKKDPTTINEELGEMGFSVLARGQKSNPARANIDQVTKSFIMTKPQMSIAHDFGIELACEDLAGKGIKGSKGNRVQPEAVSDAADFFTRMLRDFEAGTWRPVGLEMLKQHKKGVDKFTFSKCIDMKLKIKPQLWKENITAADMDRVEKRARHSILNGGKSWVFKPAHSNIWDDFKEEVKDDAKASPAVPAVRLATEEAESDNQGDAVVQPRPKRRQKIVKARARRKPVAANQSSGSEVECDGPDEDSDSSELKAVLKASSGKGRKSKPTKKSKVKSKRNRDQSPPEDHRPAKKKKAGKKTAPSTFYPLRIHGEREMEGTDELQFLIEWRDHPKKKDWTWEPSKIYIDDHDFAWLVKDHFCRRDASRQRFGGSDDDESQLSE